MGRKPYEYHENETAANYNSKMNSHIRTIIS